MTEMKEKNKAPESQDGRDDYFHQFLSRTIMLLGEEAVQALRRKTVVIAGCGGVGGATAMTLARMGVGGLILADPGRFDEPDVNRQWGASRRTLGRNKAEVYEELLKDINPEIRIRSYPEGVTGENLEALLEGADLVVDCLDVVVDLELRSRMYRLTRERGLYCITALMIGFGCMMMAASPEGMSMEEVIRNIVEKATVSSRTPGGFRDFFVEAHMDNIDRHLYTRSVASVSVSIPIGGSLLSAEAALILLGKLFPGWRPPLNLPRVLVLDPIRLNHQIVDIGEVIEG